MSPAPFSPDLRAVVRAIDALTTQVKRVADAQATPVAVIRDGVTTPLDAPTTTAVVDAYALADGTEAGFRAALAATDEDTLRLLRREGLLVLLTRLQRGRTLTEDEAGTLRHHVEAEIREANTARAVARGNLAHVRRIVPEIDRLTTELAEAQAATERVRKALDDRPPILNAEGQGITDYETGWRDHEQMVRHALERTE
ncbi:hypothetical protein [Streptomyces sp. NBC_00566]|uniref:hypothetical protein n=1 Tax=Streptomyces sp. NBC_00566 TaxID=2975778 RepID=UPI002E805A1F|nr:hypothetical protein [Streptomyces sp. NBC_00566]WUB88236.1 hypothetical protein OG812_17305 [Streptomyces sp. NBC_00566]